MPVVDGGRRRPDGPAQAGVRGQVLAEATLARSRLGRWRGTDGDACSYWRGRRAEVRVAAGVDSMPFLWVCR